LDFLFNGTDHKQWHSPPPTEAANAVAHSTTHDPNVRERLIKVIKKIDDEHYGGDIAWLDSVFPC